MKRSCRGICERYKTPKHNMGGLYTTGHKRCNTCEIYLKTEHNRCPCCENLLRTKPRNGKYKEPFRKYVTEVTT